MPVRDTSPMTPPVKGVGIFADFDCCEHWHVFEVGLQAKAASLVQIHDLIVDLSKYF